MSENTPETTPPVPAILGPRGEVINLDAARAATEDTPRNGAGDSHPAGQDASRPSEPPAPSPPLDPALEAALARDRARGPAPSTNGTHARPGPKKFERDSAELVRARLHLWQLLKVLDDELEEARSAKTASRVPSRELVEFIDVLSRIRNDVRVLHATAYAGTIGDRFKAMKPLAEDAYQIATNAGIKIAGR